MAYFFQLCFNDIGVRANAFQLRLLNFSFDLKEYYLFDWESFAKRLGLRTDPKSLEPTQ